MLKAATKSGINCTRAPKPKMKIKETKWIERKQPSIHFRLVMRHSISSGSSCSWWWSPKMHYITENQYDRLVHSRALNRLTSVSTRILNVFGSFFESLALIANIHFCSFLLFLFNSILFETVVSHSIHCLSVQMFQDSFVCGAGTISLCCNLF